jgi:signal transduction histidine kinase
MAAAFTIAAEVEVLIRLPPHSWEQGLDGFAGLALLGLAWWRRRPIVPTLLVTGSSVVQVMLGARVPMDVPQIALLVATYALGAYAGKRELSVGALLPTAMAASIDLLLPNPPYPVLSGLLWYAVFITGAPVLMGRLVRTRSQLVRRLALQRTALLTEREARATQAVTAERQRISRQLRGVVVRSVDSLVSEVAVAEADRGEVGLAALRRIEAIARKALGEMRGLLGALQVQEPKQSPPLDPVPAVLAWPRTPSGRLGAWGRRVRAATSRAPWPIALAALVLLSLEAGMQGLIPANSPRFLIDVSLIFVAAPIAWSQTRPLAAAAISLLAVTVISRLLIQIPIAGVASALLAFCLPFSVAVASVGRKALLGLAMCALGFLATFGSDAAPALVFGAAAGLAGRLLGDRIRLARELEAINRNLAEERDLRAYERVQEERLRVARELHDVIGHTLTVLVLQAGAARRNWAVDRTRASSALTSLVGVARGGLPDLLASLDALDDTRTPLPAIPGLRDISALVEQARAAGVRVTLSQKPLPTTLTPELELIAYRVVQEALTNVMKHAPGSSTEVRVDALSGRVEVEVVNTGTLRPHRLRALPEGQGLQGMAQRVAAGGGEFSWGRDQSGGFAVRARLPALV